MKRIDFNWMQQLGRVLGLLLCSAVLWTACSSDDDDDDNGGGSASTLTAGVLTGEDGISYQLLSNGDVSFVYDDEGNLTSIAEGMDGDYEITNNPFTLYRSNKYGTISISKCSFNAQGYLTKFTFEEIYEYDGEYQDCKAVYSISYNGDSQITKISTSETEIDKWDGETFSASGSEELTFTYENGNLMTVKESAKWTEDGYTFKGNGLVTFTYGSTANAARQYTVGFGHILPIDEQVADLAMVGYLGKASKHLPSQIHYTYDDGDEEDDDTYTYSYKLGTDNLLVLTEKENNTTYNYKYASDTKAIEESQLASESPNRNASVCRHRGAFRHSRR